MVDIGSLGEWAGALGSVGAALIALRIARSEIDNGQKQVQAQIEAASLQLQQQLDEERNARREDRCLALLSDLASSAAETAASASRLERPVRPGRNSPDDRIAGIATDLRRHLGSLDRAVVQLQMLMAEAPQRPEREPPPELSSSWRTLQHQGTVAANHADGLSSWLVRIREMATDLEHSALAELSRRPEHQ